jgi:hypothetical protein
MTPPITGDPVRYCGREFTASEIQAIRDLIESAPRPIAPGSPRWFARR